MFMADSMPAISDIPDANFIARLTKEHNCPNVRFVTGLGHPRCDLNWTWIPIYCERETVKVVVFYTPTFYECFRKVMGTVMPSSVGTPLH
jgi:hypothetical protein